MNARMVILITVLVGPVTIAFPAGVFAAGDSGDDSAGLLVSPLQVSPVNSSLPTIVNESPDSPDNENLMNKDNSVSIPETSVVDITGINAVNFPYILSYVTVNTTEGRTGQLKKEDFTVFENGKLMNITLIPFSDSSAQTKLDLSIVFDDTGSLGDEIADMKVKVNQLTGSITDAHIDCRYALISFKDTVSVKQQWTSDPAVIDNAVNGLYASGGDDAPEVDLDAIETALEMDFRPDAQHMILDITDEKTHHRDDGTTYSNFTIPETASHLMDKGISYILVGPTSVTGSFDSYNDKRELVKALGGTGLFFDIHKNEFSAILDRIQAIITQTYTIGYTTPNQEKTERKSTIQVRVGTDTDNGQYIASVPDQSMVSDGITPNTAQQCKTVPVTITGRNFRSGTSVKLFKDSYQIYLIDSSIRSSSISGSFAIPCDAPTGLYTSEITNPEGEMYIGNDIFNITSSGSSVSKGFTGFTGDIGTKEYLSLSDLRKDNMSLNNDCEGWEENNGYHLITRVTGNNSATDRIPNPWCWCNGYPYDKNYQSCVPMPS